MNKETVVKLYPLLVTYTAILTLGAWFYAGVFFIPWRLEDILPAWRLSDIWFLVSFYSFSYVFIYLNLRIRKWLEIGARDEFVNKKPLLEWFAVVTAYVLLALPIYRLTESIGFSDNLNMVVLTMLFYAICVGLVKRLPLVSVFSLSKS